MSHKIHLQISHIFMKKKKKKQKRDVNQIFLLIENLNKENYCVNL